jgi:hypothetical protein
MRSKKLRQRSKVSIKPLTRFYILCYITFYASYSELWNHIPNARQYILDWISYYYLCSSYVFPISHNPFRLLSLGVFTYPLARNIRHIFARIGFLGNVFTESLPNNGSLRHNILIYTIAVIFGTVYCWKQRVFSCSWWEFAQNYFTDFTYIGALFLYEVTHAEHRKC